MNKNKIIKSAKDTFLKVILTTKRFKPSESIIIFSEPRGGSTWLMEILTMLLPVCINWEPLHLDKGKLPNKEGFGFRPYIPAIETNPDYYHFFKKTHEFKIHSDWTRKYLTPTQIFNAELVLTKYVRANMLVPYLLKNFNFKFKPIFLIRHPIDTCVSQIKAFKQSKNELHSKIFQHKDNKRFIEHTTFLNQLESDLEWYIAFWCLNNCTTLENLDTNKLCVVFYSDLISTPKKEVQRILKETNLHKISGPLEKIDFRKPSSTDFSKNLKKSPQLQLSKNIDSLDSNTKDKIQIIFDYFNFKLYSAYSPTPNLKSLTYRLIQ
ncbi:sulfotransferase domain-containing protein [Pseudotamlana agarivorans]|uniref:sulfotransferase domain-containing protein n=1 Tax=Pseudotamlana agarivorans TaxID=481183 RepID=UPI000833C9DB|nr:sulfotransferase domain-containing protein [Tamlana agarivorans]